MVRRMGGSSEPLLLHAVAIPPQGFRGRDPHPRERAGGGRSCEARYFLCARVYWQLHAGQQAAVLQTHRRQDVGNELMARREGFGIDQRKDSSWQQGWLNMGKVCQERQGVDSSLLGSV